MSGAVAAVKHMHSHRVAHRDLKLENLLLADVGGDDVKVCDLGLALHVQEGARATKICHQVVHGARDTRAPRRAVAPRLRPARGRHLLIFAMVAGFFPLEVARRADWRFVKLEEVQASGGGSTCAVIYSF
uniref:Protein kinase domain-containing protein n=1 Tax=Emiliania huxleyi TaxID=2903 RepID=A0A7S3X6A7_EMIHU|mmetsp:Transcript_10468/g.34316  ORF Transcript_10468/g.34316 Transcript_10468/m.34316 type:complete len:130 (-) Transcript_10468:192-581(-)